MIMVMFPLLDSFNQYHVGANLFQGFNKKGDNERGMWSSPKYISLKGGGSWNGEVTHGF